MKPHTDVTPSWRYDHVLYLMFLFLPELLTTCLTLGYGYNMNLGRKLGFQFWGHPELQTLSSPEPPLEAIPYSAHDENKPQ